MKQRWGDEWKTDDETGRQRDKGITEHFKFEALRPGGGTSRHCIISFTFSDPGFFSEKGDISMPPSCGLLIGIYLFYENWSTENFIRRESKKELFATPAYF